MLVGEFVKRDFVKKMFIRSCGFVCCGAAALLCSMIRSEAPCAVGQDPCLCMQQNTLFLTDAKTHGAIARSVDWCCTPGVVTNITGGAAVPGVILLALGGDPGVDGATARIYALNLDTGLATEIKQVLGAGNPQLPIVTGANTSVNAVAWFCACGRTVLAIGGCNLSVPDPTSSTGATVTGDVLVFDISAVTYDSTNGIYKLTVNSVTGYVHKAPVYSLAWLQRPAECSKAQKDSESFLGYLFVGGSPSKDDVASSIDIVPYYTSGAAPACPVVSPCVPYDRVDQWELSGHSGCCGGKRALQDVILSGAANLPAAVTAQDIAGAKRSSFDTDNILHIKTGTTIRSLDVCASGDVILLAAAGGDRYDSCYDANMFVYTFTPICSESRPAQSSASIITQGRYRGGIVNNIRWCCAATSCGLFPLFVIGGCTSDKEQKNAIIYRISRGRRLCEVASTNSTDNGLTCVMGVEWSPTCPCTKLTVGGGCRDNQSRCVGNLFLYKKNACPPILEKIRSTNFDSTITSLAWCNAQGRCSFLAVGATGTLVGNDDDDDDETDNSGDYDKLCYRELGIYRASLCGNHTVCPSRGF